MHRFFISLLESASQWHYHVLISSHIQSRILIY